MSLRNWLPPFVCINFNWVIELSTKKPKINGLKVYKKKLYLIRDHPILCSTFFSIFSTTPLWIYIVLKVTKKCPFSEIALPLQLLMSYMDGHSPSTTYQTSSPYFLLSPFSLLAQIIKQAKWYKTWIKHLLRIVKKSLKICALGNQTENSITQLTLFCLSPTGVATSSYLVVQNVSGQSLQLWQYRLWSFQERDTKLESFLH